MQDVPLFTSLAAGALLGIGIGVHSRLFRFTAYSALILAALLAFTLTATSTGVDIPQAMQVVVVSIILTGVAAAIAWMFDGLSHHVPTLVCGATLALTVFTLVSYGFVAQ